MSQRLPGDQRAAPPAQVRAGRGGAGSGSPAAQGCGTAASGAEAAGAERAAPAPRQRRGSGRPGPGRGGRAGSLRIPQLVRAPPPKGRDEERNARVFTGYVCTLSPRPSVLRAALVPVRKAGGSADGDVQGLLPT